MKPNQVDVIAAPMLCDPEQIIYAFEPRFTSQIVRHIFESNLLNRVNDDITLIHWVTTTHLHVRVFPDANAALDSAVSDSIAKAFGEYHTEP